MDFDIQKIRSANLEAVSTEPPLETALEALKSQHHGIAFPDTWNKPLAQKIDHTGLPPTATKAQVKKLCIEAVYYGFRAVCVPPIHVAFARATLEGTRVGVAAVVGFPAGWLQTDLKAKEAHDTVNEGANEIDMVAATHLLSAAMELEVKLLSAPTPGEQAKFRAQADQYYRRYLEDIQATAEATVNAHEEAGLKVILETGLIRKKAAELFQANPEQANAFANDIVTGASMMAIEAMRTAGVVDGHRYIKTCTGVYEGGATEADMRAMASAISAMGEGGKTGIKASGGVRTTEATEKLTGAAGQEIIFGTSSGPTLVQGQTVVHGY